jgi:hypothetical protein
MQLALPTRFRARTIIVIATVLVLVLATLAAPARAGDGDDGVGAARATALETVNHKINSLKDYREGAKTDQAWAIYSEGIEELGDIRARILEEDNTEEIWALKSRAKAVWAETIEAAAAADAGAKDEEDGAKDEEDDGKDEEEARRKRDEEERRRRERDKAEAAVAEAYERTRDLIDKKVRLMSAASQSARHREVSDIYRWAAGAIKTLRPQAVEAGSIGGLEEVAHDVWEIIHAAKKEIADLRNDRTRTDKGDRDGDLEDKKKQRDRNQGRENGDEETDGTDDGTGGKDEGTDGKDEGNDGNDEGTDGTDEGTDGQQEGDEEDDGAEETATILIALNAMELEVDNYQITIQNTMAPEAGIGTPEGIVALEAGSELLDAIDAARALAGDDIALAWSDIINQHSTYIHLVIAYDQAWNVGLFAGEVSPE